MNQRPNPRPITPLEVLLKRLSNMPSADEIAHAIKRLISTLKEKEDELQKAYQQLSIFQQSDGAPRTTHLSNQDQSGLVQRITDLNKKANHLEQKIEEKNKTIERLNEKISELKNALKQNSAKSIQQKPEPKYIEKQSEIGSFTIRVENPRYDSSQEVPYTHSQIQRAASDIPVTTPQQRIPLPRAWKSIQEHWLHYGEESLLQNFQGNKVRSDEKNQQERRSSKNQCVILVESKSAQYQFLVFKDLKRNYYMCIPRKDGKYDKPMWKLTGHLDMFEIQGKGTNIQIINEPALLKEEAGQFTLIQKGKLTLG